MCTGKLAGDCPCTVSTVDHKHVDKKISQLAAYKSSGKYFRVGLNYNWLQDTPDKGVFFLGLWHARSFFKDHGWPLDKQQSKVQARWWEAVAGVKVKIWRLLYAGSSLRYKFSLALDGADDYRPYDVLGWGKYDKEAEGTFGLNYYLSFRIPFVRNTFTEELRGEQ